MSTQPGSPSEHHVAAERLIAAAESGVPELIQRSEAVCDTAAAQIRQIEALLAIGHALLAQAPRRARKRQDPPARHGGSAQQRWLYGEDGADQ